MSPICQGKSKATIYIQFADGKREQIESPNVPLTVEVAQVEKCNPLVKWTQSCRPGYQALSVSHLYENYWFPRDATFSFTNKGSADCGDDQKVVIKCVETETVINQFDTNKEFHLSVGGASPTVQLVNCRLACEITIKDNSGKEIYFKNGECPIKWRFACDDDCPSQFMRCKTRAYPGYRCIPCSDFRR